tara:strand:+ start:138 stop:743 length:606 start_codon:yes stop_codon:yes gene_type:complete
MAFATIDVTKGITGTIATSNLPTIPVTKGGTGLTSGTTDQFLKFTGSTTLASATGSGKLVNHWYNVQDLTGDISITNTSMADISGVNQITITPTSTSNKLFIRWWAASFGFVAGNELEIRIADTVSGNVHTGDWGMRLANRQDGSNENWDGQQECKAVIAVPRTSSTTYKIQGRVTTGTGYVNWGGTASEFIWDIMEVTTS